MKIRKPRRERGKTPTRTGNPPLGYLISFYCPTCGRHLFSHYEGDLTKENYKFKISNDWNYCSKCGQLLDLGEWKEIPELMDAEEGIEWKD